MHKDAGRASDARSGPERVAIEVTLNHQGFFCEKVRHAVSRHERIGDPLVEVRHQFGLGDRWQKADQGARSDMALRKALDCFLVNLQTSKCSIRESRSHYEARSEGHKEFTVQISITESEPRLTKWTHPAESMRWRSLIAV